MADWLTEFVDRYVNDILEKLAAHRDALAGQLLEFGDDDTVEKARLDKELGQVLEFLWAPKSLNERLDEAEVLYLRKELTFPQAYAYARGHDVHAGRRDGRIRTTGYQAIMALTLSRKTGWSWPEITEALNGPCEHVCSDCDDVPRRPADLRSGQKTTAQIKAESARSRRYSKPAERYEQEVCSSCHQTIRDDKQRVCFQCSDVTRSGVTRLKAYLKANNLYSDPAPH